MGFRVNTNIASLSAMRPLGKAVSGKEQITAKLSSGERIVRSADDAAGLAISENLKSQIRSSKQANRNANDGISMIQVAEGGLGEVSTMLTRLRELAIQSSSDTIGDKERQFTNMEYQNLLEEIQRVAEVTNFNGTPLLNGQGDKLDFQVGILNDEFRDRISFDSGAVNSTTDNLGIEGLSVETKDGARDSLVNIDEALSRVSEQRASLGALQNRLQVTSNNLETSVENLSSANSRIRDLDYAEGAADIARLNVLESAGTAVLAQANTNSQNALRLLS
ncbi:MAG: flagellin FliC [Halobacteriovoraceae bacterium]|nr:flagellin FliC [Halobacteriovoraceae bacterium]